MHGRRRQVMVAGAVALLWGLQMAFLAPALALLLTSLFGASIAQVSIVIMIYNIACLVAVSLGGRIADARGRYRTLMTIAASATVLLSIGLTVAPSLGVAVILLVLCGAPAALGMPVLFGYIKASGATKAEVVRTRAMFSVAWLAGPLLGALLIGSVGPRALTLALGVVGAATIVATLMLRPLPRAPEDDAGHVDGASKTPRRVHPFVLTALLVVIFVGLQATNAVSTSLMTLFATDTIGVSPVWGGLALGVAAALEIPALLLLARAYRGVQNDFRVLALAAVAGVLYYLGLALAASGYALVGLQVLNAMFYAAVAGVGITMFQSYVSGAGTASAMYSNSLRVGGVFAGPLIALGSVSDLGLRAVFLGCAVVVVVVLALIGLTARLAQSQAPAPS